MSKNKVFYYVESAPQILSAYRHIRQKGVSEFDMVVRLNGNHHNDEQIRQVMKDLEVNKSGDVVSHHLGLRMLFALLRRAVFGKYAEFCVADIRSPVGLCAIIISACNHFVLLDDGVASITFYQRWIKGEAIVNGGLVKRVIVRIAQMRLREITLHTMLPLASVDGLKVELNEYKFQPIDAQKKIGIDANLAVFIGSKVVEAGVCSQKYFDCVMKRFVSEFKEKKLRYVAHREEKLDKFDLFPEIEVVRLSHPLELEYGVRCDMPSVICGFYSAGLIHFLQYQDRVKIFTYGLPLELTNQGFHQSIQSSKYLFSELLGIEAK